MKLTLIRQPSVGGTTIGEILLDGKHICYTLEDQIRPTGQKVYAQTAIPAGTYQVIITMSPRFKRRLPLLLNVPGFDGIRIHAGNTKENTEGCILPGTGVSANRQSITESRKAFTILFAMIEQALKTSIPVTIEIINR